MSKEIFIGLVVLAVVPLLLVLLRAIRGGRPHRHLSDRLKAPEACATACMMVVDSYVAAELQGGMVLQVLRTPSQWETGCRVEILGFDQDLSVSMLKAHGMEFKRLPDSEINAWCGVFEGRVPVVREKIEALAKAVIDTIPEGESEVWIEGHGRWDARLRRALPVDPIPRERLGGGT